MALISSHKEEYLSDDQSYAVVCQVVKLFGIPLFKTVFVSKNINVIDCFMKAEEPDEFSPYTKTELGFKPTE